MPSPVYQYVINLVVCPPVRSATDLFMNVSVPERRVLTTTFFDVANFTIHHHCFYYSDVYCLSQFAVL